MVSIRSRPPLIFAMPAGSDLPSGGNVYNRELTLALAERATVTLTTFARANAALRAGECGIFLFDSLELDATSALGAAAADQMRLLIVHHLPSLEPAVRFESSEVARENAALSRFDGFVATSDFTRELLVARGVSENAILTVPPALPAIDASPARAYEPPLAALLVANVIPRKGVLELLEALGKIATAELGLSLRIVGRTDMDPDYVERCRRVLERSPALATAARFDGPVPYERMGAIYDEAHLLVSASSMETFGMAIHEASAHGLPVVAVDGGHVRRHFTDGAVGVLCAAASELAETLVELARDPARMHVLCANAQESRETTHYGWPEAAERFLAELERVFYASA